MELKTLDCGLKEYGVMLTRQRELFSEMVEKKKARSPA